MKHRKSVMVCAGCATLTRDWSMWRIRLIHYRYKLPLCGRCALVTHRHGYGSARPAPALKEMRRHA